MVLFFALNNQNEKHTDVKIPSLGSPAFVILYQYFLFAFSSRKGIYKYNQL